MAGISRVCTGSSNNPDTFRYTHFPPLMRRTISLRISWERGFQQKKAHLKAGVVRYEARSGNTLGGENYLRDGASPKAPRLIRQAGDNEQEPV
jgi:hypothetical protein